LPGHRKKAYNRKQCVALEYQEQAAFSAHLHSHRFWVESENRWVKLRVSTKGLRIIDKKGIDVVLADLRARGEKV
jgi:ribosomal protein L28